MAIILFAVLSINILTVMPSASAYTTHNQQGIHDDHFVMREDQKSSVSELSGQDTSLIQNSSSSLTNQNEYLDRQPVSNEAEAKSEIQFDQARALQVSPCSVDICASPGETITLSLSCTNNDPRVQVECKMISGPPGATLSSSVGNPATGTFSWVPDDEGSYQVTFQSVPTSCPSDIVCNPSEPLTIEILVSSPTRVFATFSGSFNTPETEFGHRHVAVKGTLASDNSLADGSGSYVPIGTWQLSFDYLQLDGFGNVVFSHKYDGPASTDDPTADHYVYACAANGCQGNPVFKYLDYDAQGQNFFGTIQGFDKELGVQLGFQIPIHFQRVWQAPISGSDTNPAGQTSSWTFTPPDLDPPPNCEVPADTISTLSLSEPESSKALPTASASPFCRNPPVAVAESVPEQEVLVGKQIQLSGTNSFDRDPGDTLQYEWTKKRPSDKIAPNTFSDPASSTPTFDAPNYIPSEFTSSSTPPKLLPLEFSLQVTDNHGLKSTNDATVSLDVVCDQNDQAKAEKARTFFLGLINLPLGSLKSPETVDNFKYFLSGRGDTQGLTQGVTGNGIPQPLPIQWLDNEQEFKTAERVMGSDMKKDLNQMLKSMQPGQTKQLAKTYPYDVTDKRKVYHFDKVPSDFTTAVGSAKIFADVDLKITKGSQIFGSDIVSGTVILRLQDNYDFNPGKTFSAGPLGSVTSDEIYQLIKCLGTRNFNQDTTYSKIITNASPRILDEYLVRCNDFPDVCRIKP
jgi:hypothetical protein